VLNAASRVVTGTRSLTAAWVRYCTTSFAGLTSRSGVTPDRGRVLQAGSDSSPVSERPRSTVYLSDDSDYCVAAAGADTRRQLRSSNRQLLAVPRYRLNTYGWLPGLFSCRPHSLEFSPGLYPGPDHQCRRFQTSA